MARTKPMHLDGVSIAKAIDNGPGGGPVDPQAEPAHLTDSTTGTPGSTLVAVRSDTAAHTAADANENFASLNAHINALQALLVSAGVLTS